MSLTDVRDTLKHENELLEKMIELAKNFKNDHFTGKARFLQTSWQLFLQNRYDTNAAQIKAANEDLKNKTTQLRDDFTEEIKQLDRYINVTGNGYTELWRAFLECERRISTHLRDSI